jgi:hypothetical protein
MNKFSLNESQDHVVLDNAGPMHYRFWLLHSTKRAPGAKHRQEYVQAESEISSDMFQLVWILEARFFQQSDDRRGWSKSREHL